MPKGGPPKEKIGPTQGWSGGPPAAPGPRTRTDAAIPTSSSPAGPERKPPDEAQREAERVARRTGGAPDEDEHAGKES